MKKLTTLLLALFLTTYAASAISITLAWCPNTETNLSHYKLHYVATNKVSGWRGDVYSNPTNCPPVLVTPGTNWVRNYNATLNVTNSTTGTVSNLVVGKTYYFAVTAVASDGLESDLSSEIEFTVTNMPPSRPQLFRILNVVP